MFIPRFYELRAEMSRKRITVNFLADYVGVSPAVMSKKLNGITPFRLDECYLVLGAIGADPSDMARYFPPEVPKCG